jgi:uncharacterized membrane protein
MSGERNAIFEWVRQGRIAPANLRPALELAGVTPDAAQWRRFVDGLLLGLGASMIAAGAIFFVAFNWRELGRYAKFALIEIPIVIAVAACWWRGLDSTVGKSALIAAALLTGALLALVGQTYQTGADTYELFAAWALAITAWVAVARLPALVLVWLAIVQLALLAYFSTFERIFGLAFRSLESVWLSFAFNTAALIAWEVLATAGIGWLRERWAIRVVAFVSGAAATTLAVWSAFKFSTAGPWPLVAYAAWLAAAAWAYRWRTVDLFVLACAVLSVIIVTTVALAKLVLHGNDAGGFLLIGVVVIAGAALGTWWLRGIAAEERA